MRTKNVTLLTVMLALSLAAVVSWAAAQSIDLRPSPRTDAPAISPTAKGVKCGTITESGSYVVKKNLTAEGSCIVIAADFVTIDLGGFTLTGDGTGNGIWDGGVTFHGTAVRDGAITGFSNGINLSSSFECKIESVRVFENGFRGIQVSANSIVSHNIVTNNGADGIVAQSGTSFRNNVASENGAAGIVADFGSTVNGNTVRSNVDDGLRANCPSNIIENTATNNGTNMDLNGVGCIDFLNVAP